MTKASMIRIFSRPLAVLAGTALCAASVPAAEGAGRFDRIVVGVQGFASEGVLPAGDFSPVFALGGWAGPIVFLPDGRQVTVWEDLASPVSLRRMLLQEIGEDGSLRPIGQIAPAAEYPLNSEFARDLGVDSEGRLYLLSDVTGAGQRLTELRPGDASTVSTRFLSEWATGLAGADAGGLWTFDSNACLRRLEIASGQLGEWRSCHSPLNTTNISTADTDSQGRVYFTYSYVCSPPCGYIGSLDPATGDLRMNEFGSAFPGFFPLDRVAIQRVCDDTATARCLAGGRFRAEIEYAAYDGAAGMAQAAPARSADTAIFSFFDPDNWELMVKVLDGCAINSHFWVYAAASTDVEYTMTITDTWTGARKVYSNPLGQVARTVTDNQAFSCSAP